MQLLFESTFAAVISFYINLASTLYMFGLVWFVQIVHYPLLEKVGKEAFDKYQHGHQIRTSLVVTIPMILELATSIHLYVFSTQSQMLTRLQELETPLLIGMILTILIWASTLFFQMPMHKKLEGGFNEKAHLFLVRSNWIRTVCWSLRAAICLIISFAMTL